MKLTVRKLKTFYFIMVCVLVRRDRNCTKNSKRNDYLRSRQSVICTHTRARVVNKLCISRFKSYASSFMLICNVNIRHYCFSQMCWTTIYIYHVFVLELVVGCPISEMKI